MKTIDDVLRFEHDLLFLTKIDIFDSHIYVCDRNLDPKLLFKTGKREKLFPKATWLPDNNGVLFVQRDHREYIICQKDYLGEEDIIVSGKGDINKFDLAGHNLLVDLKEEIGHKLLVYDLRTGNEKFDFKTDGETKLSKNRQFIYENSNNKLSRIQISNKKKNKLNNSEPCVEFDSNNKNEIIYRTPQGEYRIIDKKTDKRIFHYGNFTNVSYNNSATPYFSNSGEKFAFYNADEQALIISNLRGNKQKYQLESNFDGSTHMSWSSNNKKIAFTIGSLLTYKSYIFDIKAKKFESLDEKFGMNVINPTFRKKVK